MAKTNFENLRVYQFSEELADAIWEIASGWDNFAKNTVGQQIVRSADSVGANIAEGEVAAVTKIIDGLSKLLEVLCKKLNIGFGVLIKEIC